MVINLKNRKIRALLIENGLTQIDLAEKLEIDQSTLSLKLNGRRQFLQKEIEKILSLFNKPYEEIFFENQVHATRINHNTV